MTDGDWVESKDQDPNGNIRLVQLADIGDGRFLDKSSRYMTEEKANELKCTHLVKGDILIARMPDPLGRACIFPGLAIKAVTAVDVCIIRTNDQVDDYWLVHAINSFNFRKEILRRASGSTRTRISRRNLERIPSLVPPLPEQRKIAEILGAWDKAITLTERRIEAAQQRKKALMQRLLSGHVRFPGFVRSRKAQSIRLGIYPGDWKIRRLSDVTEIRSSNVDKKTKPSEQPVLLCNYMDVFNNDYIHKQIEFMEASATQTEIEKFTLKAEDVIITKDSETREEIAEPCVVTEDLENVICGYHLAVLRPRRNIISGFFLKDALRSFNVHHQFVKFANGITRFGLTLPAVHSVLVPVPPIEEQRKIAAVLQTCDREIDLLIQKLTALQRQKKGLMQRLLTGRVRVNV